MVTELILSLTQLNSSEVNWMMASLKTLWPANSTTSSLTRQILVSVSFVGLTAIGSSVVDRCRIRLEDSVSWRVCGLGLFVDILLCLIDTPIVVIQSPSFRTLSVFSGQPIVYKSTTWNEYLRNKLHLICPFRWQIAFGNGTSKLVEKINRNVWSWVPAVQSRPCKCFLILDPGVSFFPVLWNQLLIERRSKRSVAGKIGPHTGNSFIMKEYVLCRKPLKSVTTTSELNILKTTCSRSLRELIFQDGTMQAAEK